MVEALLVALLDDVAEALRGDEGGLRPLALDQRIGGERCAVDEDGDILRLRPEASSTSLDALDHAQFRRVGGGEDLAAPALRAVFQHDVREGAARCPRPVLPVLPWAIG